MTEEKEIKPENGEPEEDGDLAAERDVMYDAQQKSGEENSEDDDEPPWIDTEIK